jgi:hypothetical protein
VSKKDTEKTKEFHKKLVVAKKRFAKSCRQIKQEIENNEVKITVIIKGDERFKGFDKND